MSNGVIVWLIIFAVSAAVFFVTALVVSIKGLADLRSLLQASRHSDSPEGSAGEDTEEF